MSWTLPGMRRRLYRAPEFADLVGYAGTATVRSATSITDPVMFGGSNLGEWHFSDGWLRLQHITDANGRVKRAGALAGSALGHADTANWASPFTGLTYEYTWPDVHPDDLDRCITDPLRQLYVPNWLPATPWKDGNFEAADLDSWVGVNANRQKLTDQIYGLVGSRSLLATNTAANGYVAHSSGINVQPGETWQLNSNALCVQGGPLYWRIYNFTGGVWGTEIDADRAIGYGLTALRFRRTVKIPAGVYTLNCRMQATDNGAIHAWDALPGRNLSERRFELDSYLKASFNVLGMAEARYGETLNAPSVGADNARSRSFESWNRGPDYDTEHLPGNASPNAVRINRNPHNVSSQTEFWFASQRTWWDVQPIGELDASDAPEEAAYHMAAANLCDLLNKDGRDPYWLGIKGGHVSAATAEMAARPVATPPRRPQHVGGRIGPGYGRGRGYGSQRGGW